MILGRGRKVRRHKYKGRSIDGGHRCRKCGEPLIDHVHIMRRFTRKMRMIHDDCYRLECDMEGKHKYDYCIHYNVAFRGF